MRFIPSKYKFKKQQKGKAYNKITVLKIPLNQGNIGLRALEHVRLTSKQLTALRNQLRKKLKKKAKIIFPIFPQSCVTSKPAEVRMGKGKGNVSFWAVKIKAGCTICEIVHRPRSRRLCLKVLEELRHRFSILTNIVERIK